MNRYTVIVTYRPHVNSAATDRKELHVTAHNRDQALFTAGRRFGLEQTGIVADSAQFEVRRAG